MTEPRSETSGTSEANQANRADHLPNDSNDPAGNRAEEARKPFLFGQRFSEKEEKQITLYMVSGIVLAELAITLGAVIHSITNATVGADGTPQFRFPWLGYLVAMLVAPAVILLLAQLVGLVFSRPAGGGQDTLENVPPRVRTLYALVHGAPTILVLLAVVLIGAAVYYLDGVLALLLKIGDSFQTIAIWLIGGFTAAWIVSYAVRAAAHYKLRQMEAEYAFRRDVLERTGMVLLDARHAPFTDSRLLPAHDPDAPAALNPGDTRALPQAETGPFPPDGTDGPCGPTADGSGGSDESGAPRTPSAAQGAAPHAGEIIDTEAVPAHVEKPAGAEASS